MIKPPAKAKADSPCSKASGPTTICVLGEVNPENGEITGQRVSDVSVSGFTIRGFRLKGSALGSTLPSLATLLLSETVSQAMSLTGSALPRSVNTTVAKNHLIGSPKTTAEGILVGVSSSHQDREQRRQKLPRRPFLDRGFGGSTNTTIVGNDLVGNWARRIRHRRHGTKILSNDMSRSGFVGTFMAGQKSANAKVVGNNISGGPCGIYVDDAQRGSFAGNTIHDNCAGMFFEAFKARTRGDFEVKGNTVENNTRSCRAAQFGRNFSGIGIALLGASGMELTANDLSGNVPSAPPPSLAGSWSRRTRSSEERSSPRTTPSSATTSATTGRTSSGTKSGSGNRFVGNNCDTSVPARLCN